MSATAATEKHAARGKVIEIKEEGALIVFRPSDTNYEMHLRVAGSRYAGPVGTIVSGVVRVSARKLLTVPSGGLFIAPIFGPPRTIQGRVRHVDEREVILHAGAAIHVELPADDSAIDLTNGPIAVGSLLNVMALPGARFELLA